MKKFFIFTTIVSMIAMPISAGACPNWECQYPVNYYGCGCNLYNEVSYAQPLYCAYCGNEGWNCTCGYNSNYSESNNEYYDYDYNEDYDYDYNEYYDSDECYTDYNEYYDSDNVYYYDNYDYDYNDDYGNILLDYDNFHILYSFCGILYNGKLENFEYYKKQHCLYFF